MVPKDKNGVVDKINKMPNEVEDIIVWKSDLMKKSMCAFKDCCSYLEMSEKSATITNMSRKYDKKEKQAESNFLNTITNVFHLSNKICLISVEYSNYFNITKRLHKAIIVSY